MREATEMVVPEEVGIYRCRCRSTIDASASESKNISSLMEEQNTAVKAFHNGKDVFHLSLSLLQQEFDQ